MTEFRIGDVVRIKNKVELVDLIVRDIAQGFYKCVSTCGYFEYSKAACDLELVNRPDPQADIKQAIREVLLSDEFLAKFAAAWMKTPLPIAMPCDPKEPTKAQQLAERTMKAIWRTNDGDNQ